MKASFEFLIAAGAVVPGNSVNSILCEMCDHPHWIVPEHLGAGRYRGFCTVSGYHTLSVDSVRCLVLSDDWIVGEIAGALGLRPKKTPFDTTPIISVGRARFGPYSCEVFFGRHLADRSRAESASAILKKKIGAGIGILLTSTRLNLLPYTACERCAVIAAEDALSISSGRMKVDQDVILAALREPANLPKGSGIGVRFSIGFRSCLYRGEQYRFTDKQSQAVEALYDAWKDGLPGLDKDELKARVGTNQRMAQLFLGNPAYSTLIKHDGCGLYWLDL